MDIGVRRIVYLVITVSIIVYCVASDSQFCRIQERPNMGLSKIQDPAQILSVGYEFQSASDCYDACCNYTENQCNAVSFYDIEKLCMLLNCRPFRNCVWVNADGFVAARIQMTSVADDAQPPPSSLPIPPSINDPMVSSMTSQQPMGLTTSQALVEQVTSAPTTTQITATTTPSTSKGLETSSTQPLNPDTSSNSVQAPASFDSTNSSEVFDWNMNNEDNLSEEATPIGLLTTAKSDSSQQTAAPTVQGDGKQPDDQHFDDMLDSQSFDEWKSPNLDAPLPSNPASESSLVEPVFLSNEGEGSNGRPREMKRMLIHSPGIIIGLCSAFGVAFLVLLAVVRKIYLSQDRPRYKPLRDYDIRFEPPAASSALLP